MGRKNPRTVAALAALLLIVAGFPAISGNAQQGNTPDAGLADSPEETASLEEGIALEEIIVYGDRTLTSLQREVYRAEEAFYDVFNTLNSDDDYDITCEQRARFGSRITHRVCEPRFVADLNAEYAQAWLRGQPLPPLTGMLMSKHRLLNEEMSTLTRQEPLLMQMLVRIAESKQKLEEERERRCAGRIFCR